MQMTRVRLICPDILSMFKLYPIMERSRDQLEENLITKRLHCAQRDITPKKSGILFKADDAVITNELG